MRTLIAVFVLALMAWTPTRAGAQSIRGFPQRMVEAQRARERQAFTVPQPDTLREQMRILSEEPHHAGAPGSRRVADLLLARFRAYGLDARLERFEALMPYPVSRTVEMIAPERRVAQLAEPRIPEDKDSGDAGQLPTYNAYSPDGDVTGELVYVNYGTPEDYAVLDSLGISVEGRIVLARYGRSWRGIKPKVAAEHGAIACIIYSDPRDDGYFVEEVYPAGPMRNEDGVQRGSVMDMPRYPGDPMSPGWGSVEGARKLAMSEVRTFSPIPVLPLSYGDALPLLRNLDGPVVPDAWKGALPVTYRMGPGPARVRVALRFDWQVRPIWNVVARVPGARWPDQWVIFGNHHDAWVNGAEDPISGMVALGETARAVGALLTTGWRPARTLIFIGWDAEEWGLLGSTEWAEHHADELKQKAVAYINSDTNNRGWLAAAGSHSLEAFVREIARDIPDPKSGRSVLDALMERQRAQRAATRTAAPAPLPVPADSQFSIGALGSGSDYTAFLDHLGLASLNLSYGGDAPAGIYHSIYDSFDHYRRFMDTTFMYGVTEARTLATAALRLADAPVLPFEFGAVVKTYRRYVDEIEKGAKDVPALASLDLGAVRAALDRVEAAAARWEMAHTAGIDRIGAMSDHDVQRRAGELAAVNQLLYQTERLLTDDAGLPDRPWFRHLIYAPGFYTGYGVKTMPGIREAVEDVPSLPVAQEQAARLAAALERYAARIDEAAAALDRIR
ncbi:MAG: M28 family peptidase [Gemmatimonadetes bacterium]|nr:M28 family peptidase [Gemmatimonadota bacterium]